MSEQSAPVAPVYKGERRCKHCGKVHDAYLRDPENPSGQLSWADPVDGHVYETESWIEVARRYGWSPEAEREQFGVASR